MIRFKHYVRSKRAKSEPYQPKIIKWTKQEKNQTWKAFFSYYFKPSRWFMTNGFSANIYSQLGFLSIVHWKNDNNQQGLN